MSKRTVIFIAIFALAVGVLLDRYLIRPTSPPVASVATPEAQEDAAAASATRAMTFTQPKAPTQ